MKQNKIGVFDSGIGGINVLKELINSKPNNEYVYFGDSIHLPFGTKTKEELFLYATNIINFFISLGIKKIIVACGTISSTIFDDLVKYYPDIELISIINPTINYINNSNYQKVLLIATPNTINNGYFSKKINKEVIKISTPAFVPIIEHNETNKFDYYIDLYLKNIKDIDVCILGCTHYPVLKNKIEDYLKLPTIDMGKIIANDIKEYGNKNVTIYFSYTDENIKTNVKNILGDYPIIRKEL